MKIINQNLKKNEVKIKIDNLDDLWYLSHIIDIGDIVKGRTLRKIKIGEKEERRTEVVKKPVFMAIEVEKIEFKEDILRVSGVVTEGPEDIGRGVHDKFNLESDTQLTIVKEKWLRFQLDKLNEAAAAKQADILILVLDREEAIFALSTRSRYKVLGELKGDVAKKEERVVIKGSFYGDVAKNVKSYSERYNVENVIIASPAFWKEDLMKFLDSDLKKKVTLATCGSVGRNAIDEVLKRPETKEVLKKDRLSKESLIVEELLSAISKEDLGVYGIREVSKAADAGAVEKLLVTDKFISKRREEGKYEKVDSIMKIVDSTKGSINLINSEFEAGKKLDGLGGIGAVLRYKMNY